jgi:hypothetical protein
MQANSDWLATRSENRDSIIVGYERLIAGTRSRAGRLELAVGGVVNAFRR